MAEVNTEVTENKDVERHEETTQQNTNTQKEATVDTEKIKNDAITEYLKGLGVEDGDTLKGIVTKAKEEEEKNKTDLQKSLISTTTSLQTVFMFRMTPPFISLLSCSIRFLISRFKIIRFCF